MEKLKVKKFKLRVFINLTPFVPLSIRGRSILCMRGNCYLREASPLFDSPFSKGDGVTK